MEHSKHQWVSFIKGRMKVNACLTCGELKLPSNSELDCTSNKVFKSQLIKAGYRLYSRSVA